MSSVRVSGAGCGLLDVIYPDADFSSPEFDAARSREAGDGGIDPGGLVFESALLNSRGVGGRELARRICRGASPTENVGGPALVALIHAAQVLQSNGINVSFHGRTGNDDMGRTLRSIVAKSPLDIAHLEEIDGQTPHTVVLSDPDAHDGAGERAFVNAVAAAEAFGEVHLSEDFFTSSVVVLGGTALVPTLHHELGAVLRKAKNHDALTIVNTVYDFKNEMEHPGELWPLGSSRDTYQLIDLLMTDAEEARKLSGLADLDDAARLLTSWGAGAVVITDGANGVRLVSGGKAFSASPLESMPVSTEPRRRAATINLESRDTTGCGDNFAGGVIANLALQIDRSAAPNRELDLREAVIDGIAAGAAAWFYLGGTWVERHPGEKAEMVNEHRQSYLAQLSESESA